MPDYSALGNFDPNMMRDQKYKEVVNAALQMKQNAEEVLRSQPKIAQPVQPQPENKQDNKSVILTEKLPNDNPSDFKMSDFTNVQKYDPNSPVSKMQNPQVGTVQSVGSIWMSKEDMKKYFATKNIFKIKILNEQNYKTYRFRSIGSEQQEKLYRMSNDLANFYPLMLAEENEIEGMDDDKPTKVLLRDGKHYKHVSELMTDYRREIAFMCLGIEYDEFDKLEQFSDPEYTVQDVWGINDVITGLLERSLQGTSYFRIAFNQL
ncbi:MAG TPA: hypothetical protein VL854_12990 [Nitrososphaeraceae archaeon]|nr:hypothetical protein [Nitrososphaeraceae archaeon]